MSYDSPNFTDKELRWREVDKFAQNHTEETGRVRIQIQVFYQRPYFQILTADIRGCEYSDGQIELGSCCHSLQGTRKCKRTESWQEQEVTLMAEPRGRKLRVEGHQTLYSYYFIHYLQPFWRLASALFRWRIWSCKELNTFPQIA